MTESFKLFKSGKIYIEINCKLVGLEKTEKDAFLVVSIIVELCGIKVENWTEILEKSRFFLEYWV